MYRIKTLNKISSAGLDQLDKSRFQVGNDVEATRSPQMWNMKSMPTFSAPVPPRVWIVAARPDRTISLSAPKTIC